MTIRVKTRDGITVEVDSAEELRVVLSAIGDDRSGQDAEGELRHGKAPTFVNVSQFIDGLDKRSNQYALILALALEPEGMTAEELVSKLGLSGKPALGGTMATLSKWADKVGLCIENILTSGTRGDEEAFVYRLTEQALKGIPPE